MKQKYEIPVAETVSLHWEKNICLSGGGTEDVGVKPEMTDDDFE